MRKILILTFVMLLSIFGSSSYSVPMELSHQGRLIDATGEPLHTGTYTVIYKLYDALVDGNLLWEESVDVNVSDGFFSAVLGKTSILDLSDIGADPDNLYMEIQLLGDDPMAPRIKLTQVPSASQALSLNGDVKTKKGEMHIDWRDTDDDNDGILMYDTMDSTALTISEVDALGNQYLFQTKVYQPGQPIYGNITFENISSGGTPDTTYLLENKVDVCKEVFKQDFGPVQGTRRISQGADSDSGYVEASAFNQLDSSNISLKAIESRSVLKTFFETGDKPTSSQLGSTEDTSFLKLNSDISNTSLTAEVSDQSSSFDLRGAGGGGRVVLSVPVINDPTTGVLPEITLYEDGSGDGTNQLYENLLSPRGYSLKDSLGNDVYSLRSQDDGVIRTSTWTQLEGPFTSSTCEVGNGGVSHTFAWDTQNDLSPRCDIKVDSLLSKIHLKAAAERAFDAVISVEPINPNTADEFISGSLAFRSISTDLFDTIDVFDLTGTADGAAMSFIDSSGNPRMKINCKKGDKISLVGFGNFSGVGIPDTSFAFDTLGNAQFAGFMSVGTPEQLASLTVGGDICATGIIGECSDIRYKTEISSLTNALERVSEMNAVTFQWDRENYPEHNFSENQQIGFVAQELKEILPQVVIQNSNGYYSIDYGKLTPILVRAIQEQQELISLLENRVQDTDNLRNQVNEMQMQLQEMMNKIERMQSDD